MRNYKTFHGSKNESFRWQSAILVAIAVTGLAFSWWAPPAKKEPRAATKREAAKPKPSEEARPEKTDMDQTQDLLPVETLQTLRQVSGLTSIPRLANLPPIQKLPATVTRPIPNLPKTEPSLVQVQKQITDIIRLNDGLKLRHMAQAAEIQKIRDTTQTHQKIVEEIKKAREEQARKKKEQEEKRQQQLISREGDSQELDSQEKLRLIEAETEANRRFLEELNQQSPSDSNGGSSTSSRSAPQQDKDEQRNFPW